MRLWASLGMLLWLSACDASSSSDTSLPGDRAQLITDEIDLVKLQIEGCWKLPAATDTSVDFRPEFRVGMNRDGTVRSVDLLNQEQLNDQNFSAAANSAKEALLDPRCQPLKFPAEKYERWQTFTITFDSDRPAKGSFDGLWSATVGPQGSCSFTSVLALKVSGPTISGSATNPWGVFPLAGTVAPSGEGTFKIVSYGGIIRFSGNTFEANYANDCGARHARGYRESVISLNVDDESGGDQGAGQ